MGEAGALAMKHYFSSNIETKIANCTFANYIKVIKTDRTEHLLTQLKKILCVKWSLHMYMIEDRWMMEDRLAGWIDR